MANLPYIKSTTQTRIEEEPAGSATGGRFGAWCPAFDAPGSQITKKTFTLLIPISILTAQIRTKGKTPLDRVKLCVSPNTTVGALSQAVGVGDTELPVASSVIDLFGAGKMWVGQQVKLENGGSSEEVGIIVGYSTNSITVSNALVAAFAAGTLVKVTVCMTLDPSNAKNGGWIELDDGDVLLSFGGSKIGGSYIPAGTVVCIEYDNISGSQVRVQPFFEILY